MINAAVAGVLFGAAAGAIIGYSLGAVWPGALIGAVLFGLGEALTDWQRRPGEQKPRLYRALTAVGSGAVLGALAGIFLPNLTVLAQAVLIGFIIGLGTLNWKSLLLAVLSGLVVGLLAVQLAPALAAAVLGALVVLLHQILSWLFLKNSEPVTLAAENVPASEIPYVVPYVARSAYIGADYFQDLANLEAGDFQRNTPDVGIVETMDSLRGLTFNPDRVDPLIREFYEHTTRFQLAIVPVWKLWMKPVFWLYKQWIAQPIGQANLPFNQEEAQRGIVSYIDTIDLEQDDQINIRGWVRAFAETGEAIYVGIYTTFRQEDRGYVSVGFPLPESNFTATLLPYNKDGSNFILKSRGTGLPFPGHYLSTNVEGELTVLALPSFNEEIEVFIEEGQLKTHHRFYLGEQNFLTLYYTIDRKI